MTTQRLLIVGLAIGSAAVLTAGCSHHSGPDPSVSPAYNTQQTRPAGDSDTLPDGRSATVIATESPPPAIPDTSPAVTPNPAISTPAIPDAATATASPAAVAKAWAIAANSSSYRDLAAGTWTERAKPFVTGAEASAELQQHSGGGGSTWAQIQSGKCVSSLRQLAINLPSDAPTGPARRVVYLTAISTLTCATGHVQLSQLAAQLILAHIHGLWLVAEVHH